MSRFSTEVSISELKAVRYDVSCAIHPIADRKPLLDAVVKNLQADRIGAVSLIGKRFTIYLKSMDDVQTLLQMKYMKFRNENLFVSHAVNAYTLYNVPPSLTENDLLKILLLYGDVVHVEPLPFCSGVPEYDHIIGSERRVFFKVSSGAKIDLPEKLVNKGEEDILVYKHCVICNKDGHSFNFCTKSSGLNCEAVIPKTDDNISSEISKDGHTFCNKSSALNCEAAIPKTDNNISSEILKEQAVESDSKDVSKDENKLLNASNGSMQEHTSDDNESVISLPSDAFEYVNNVTTLSAKPLSEDTNNSSNKKIKSESFTKSSSYTSESSSHSSSANSSSGESNYQPRKLRTFSKRPSRSKRSCAQDKKFRSNNM